MKCSFLIVFLFFYYSAIGQDWDCPCPIVSNYNCQYPKQTGKLDIIRNDSLKITVLKTEETELVVPDNLYISSEFKDSISGRELVTNLFKNGLLTTDLILKEFNRKIKLLNRKGDTLDDTKHENSKVAKMESIIRKKSENHVVFEIAIVFKPTKYDSIINIKNCAYCLQSIDDFELELSLAHRRPLTEKNIDKYLKKCEIDCFRWKGFEI